jgi:hypothetical protein
VKSALGILAQLPGVSRILGNTALTVIPRSFVRDIMQKISECAVADIQQIERATVAAVSNMFAKNQFTHVPVVQTSESGQQRLNRLGL